MKPIKQLLFILLLSSVSLYGQKINGISFVASGDSISYVHTNPVRNVNASHVALMPFGFIKNLSSPEIRFNEKRQWFGEREIGIQQYAKEFRKKGIKVMLKPQIWVWRGEYTGHIEMDSEEKWKILEESYESFILTYANTAKKIKAEIFCIGTELEKFVAQRPEYWKSLIKKIRKIYKGKLTYAANWDEFKRVKFWSLLDYIGVDAYFPITDIQTPSIQDFEKGWKQPKEEIRKIQSTFQKPILFTEFGYRSIHYTGKEPWDSKRVSGEVNLEAQSNGLQALHNQFWKESWFAGGFIWKWFHRHDRVGGKDNNRFTPQNKPAEDLIKKLYKTK
ncbi:glycoside hydrolase [Pseudotenacibaculum sp. MALMAid0570]|uniref:glycoside hydrolase family 113 n=1 Tax=Pseudotenacibaculum sp. MALMAid0570 TaxID=3143938 RepID=UPI0032DF5E13